LLLSADAKRRLEKLVIKKGGFRTMGQKMTNEDGVAFDDPEVLKTLMIKDGQVFDIGDGNSDANGEILSDQDLEVLCDRSDEAYEQAAAGAGNADGWKVVETGAHGLVATGDR